MGYAARSLQFIKEHGLRSFVLRSPRYAYQHLLRPRLPRTSRTVEYNTVEVRPYRIGDRLLPFTISPNQGSHPNPDEYEAELVTQVRNHVSQGDSVAVIGGGLGVSTVVSARQTGRDGTVNVYEAGTHLAKQLQETVSKNNVADRVTVHHAVVGDDVKVEGEVRDADTVTPEGLPECDVLVMDCEGAETMILESLSIRPRRIIVETHGNRSVVKRLVSDLGYEIGSEELAESPPMSEMCVENGIYVLSTSRVDK